MKSLILLIACTFVAKASTAANFYWVNILGSNWNNALNWSSGTGGLGGAGVPGINDIAIFDGGPLGVRSGNCTIDIPVNIAGITMSLLYAGTISQGSNGITISGAASFGSGKFTGGSAAITIGTTFTISATTFTSTTNILELRGDAAFTGGSFTHNNGWTRFNGAGSQMITGTSPAFYDLEFVGRGNTYTISSTGNIGVTNTLNLSGSSSLTMNSGALNVSGNINLTNTATGDGGTTTININGAASQSITSSLSINQGTLPSININKPSGTLTLPAIITVMGNWTYTTGALDAITNNSNVVFAGNLTITGNHTLNNINFEASNNFTFTVAAATTLTVSGTMSLTGTNTLILNSGTISLMGNLALTNTSTGDGGTTTIAFTGATGQAITSALAINQSTLPAININKPGGTLTFPNLITVKGNWTYTTGAIDAATNNATVVFAGTLSITGTHTLNNVTLEGNNNWTFTIATGTILTTTGTFNTIGAFNIFISSPVAGATAIDAQGDITINNTSVTGGGTAQILINGPGAQNLTGNSPAAQGLLPYIKIQKPSGTLTITGTISVSRDWTYASGTVNPTTSTVNFGGNSLTITSNGMSFAYVTIRTNTTTVANNFTITNNLNIVSPAILAPGTNTINLAGNWNNYGTAGFTEASSTVNFNGTTQQVINTTAGENFTNATVNNPAGIQLINNIAVASGLTMTQGNIDLNGNTVTLGVSAASPGILTFTAGTMINTGSFTRWFAKTTIADGSTTGLFPTGTSTDFRPFNISIPTAPTTGGTITVAYNDAATNTITSFPDGAATIVLRKNLDWVVSSATLAGGAYNASVAGTGYGLVGAITDFRLTLANSVVATAGTNAGTTINPLVYRTALTQTNLNNTFYLASINAVSSPLPITLISFTAALMSDNKEVLLSWSTSVETNNDHFTVQRSTDSSHWESIDQVPGAENTSTQLFYKSFDRSPLSGTSYYRLMQTDLDGKQTYSFIRPVNRLIIPGLSIYPNPASDHVTVNLQGKSSYEVSIFNASGQLLLPPVESGNSTKSINVSNLSAGVYFLHIIQGDHVITKGIVIRR